MLVDDKFFYISLPRCASTSFYATCITNKISLKVVDDSVNEHLKIKITDTNLSDINYINFGAEFRHSHEPLNLMVEKFGNFDTISVKRNKYDRFISSWNHFLHEMYLYEHPYVFRKCLTLKLNDILFYKSENIHNRDSVEFTINEFIHRNKLEGINQHGKNMIAILLKPISDYHHHNKNIIWFDFEKLYELENWVSYKLNREFKLMKINSNNQYFGHLKLNDEFKIRYDSIYDVYDVQKNEKTLI